MQLVAHHLQVEACSRPPAEKDQFARSAYNRYYYAIFLVAREMVADLYPDKVTSLGHKAYPEFLRGTVTRELKRQRSKAQKNTDSQLITQIRRALSAINDLADQFERANLVRIIADYYPDEEVVFESQNRFALGRIHITDAHNWESSARRYCKTIVHAWGQFSV